MTFLSGLALVVGIIALGALAGALAGYLVVRWYARTPEKVTPLSPSGYFCAVTSCTTPALPYRQADGRRVCAEHKVNA